MNGPKMNIWCFLKNHDLEILDYDVFNAGQPLCVAIIKNSK